MLARDKLLWQERVVLGQVLLIIFLAFCAIKFNELDFNLSSFQPYAGPLATVTAAIVAAIFAWQQRKIAFQQKEIAQEKLRLDLFEKRYETYETVFAYYDAVLSWSGSEKDESARQAFFLSYHRSRFLFGEDVELQFRNLIDAGVQVIGFKQFPDTYRYDPQLFIRKNNEISKLLLVDFDRGIVALKEAIAPFIDFSNVKARGQN